MFGGSTAAKRFLQMIRNISADEDPFAISHLNVTLTKPLSGFTLQIRNRSISRILSSEYFGVAIIHLVQPLPAGSSDLPGGRSLLRLRAGSPVDASLFGLALRGVCLAADVTTRAGALLH